MRYDESYVNSGMYVNRSCCFDETTNPVNQNSSHIDLRIRYAIAVVRLVIGPCRHTLVSVVWFGID